MPDSKFAARRWWRIAPVVFVTFSLAFLDRANFGLAAAAGMARDLHVSPGMSSLIGAMFFLGYFAFQIPGAIYAQKRRVKKLVFVSLLVWGAAASLTGVVRGAHLLLGVRFVLGVAEAAVIPSMLIYLSHWFTRSERSRANTFLILGNPVTVLWMSVVSGYLIRAFDWRWMFIAEGFPAIVWAFVWWWLISERPADAAWLSGADQRALAETLAAEQRGMESFKNCRAAFRSRNVILLALQYFCWSIGAFGFILWLPSILKGSSAMGIVQTGWLSAVPYLFAIGAMLGASRWSDRMLDRKWFIWPFLLVGAVAFYASYLLGAHHFWSSFVLLVIAGAAMYAPFGVFFALIPDLMPQNVAGGAIALINSMGGLGSFVGAYVVGYLNGVTGGPGAAFMFMAGALALAVVLTLLVRPAASARP